MYNKGDFVRFLGTSPGPHKGECNMERSSGVLLAITSLPSKYGIGTLGKEAFAFADFLKEAGQKYWQGSSSKTGSSRRNTSSPSTGATTPPMSTMSL